MKINILVIEDHPTQIDGYKSILCNNNGGNVITITEATTAEKAMKIIKNPLYKFAFDMVFLDWTLPAHMNNDLWSGEDLGKQIHLNMPASKIVVITSHTEAFTIYNIVRKVPVSGVLIKSDFNAADLINACETIYRGDDYFSPTARKFVHELTKRSAYLDLQNQKIIILLAQGMRTTHIAQYFNVSKSAIEKRKVTIKEYLGIEKGNDEDIVREARRRSYI